MYVCVCELELTVHYFWDNLLINKTIYITRLLKIIRKDVLIKILLIAELDKLVQCSGYHE